MGNKGDYTMTEASTASQRVIEDLEFEAMISKSLVILLQDAERRLVEDPSSENLQYLKDIRDQLKDHIDNQGKP